ncbi:MAG: DUF3305 domain-containing protein [Hyphomicrobiales bacterium]|nr:DUF3305 domain-containing protein [Hyphomicrobiales bacterium]
MEKELTIRLGVVVEKTRIDHPWQEWRWQACGVLVDPPETAGWRELVKTENGARFHAANLPLILHRKETESYLQNLVTGHPKVFVVMRENDDPDDDAPFEISVITVSAYEAQDYTDTGEEIVEAVSMPDKVRELLEAFIGVHHVEEEFKKRKRDRINVEDEKFGKEPVFQRRSRMTH